MRYFVYLLASCKRGILYVGVTGDLVRRVYQHKEGLANGFTREYGVKRLVWFDATDSAMAAIEREKQIKYWNRAWKIELIEAANPEWRDLYEDLVGGGPQVEREGGWDCGSSPQ